jgi:peptidoglycan lytic transglycosylase
VSTGTATVRASRRAARRRAQIRRRRLSLGAGVVVLLALAVVVLPPLFQHAVREIGLPLRHEDIIRQQAAEKNLDPALVAGVIYAESKFVDRTSPAGAKGLMQLMPDTARFIADRSGGTRFALADLGTPQVNIAYGAWYLRYLLDHYDGNEVPALAAYNGGETNVNRWMAAAHASARGFHAADIPFTETRRYVDRVLGAERRYARAYPDELGLR